MATVVSQHVRHLGVFKNNIFSKIVNFLELSRKHLFRASTRNIDTNTVFLYKVLFAKVLKWFHFDYFKRSIFRLEKPWVESL